MRVSKKEDEGWCQCQCHDMITRWRTGVRSGIAGVGYHLAFPEFSLDSAMVLG